MNIQYLMEHISRHLHTLIRRYSADWTLLDSFCARADFQDDSAEPFLRAWGSSPGSRDGISGNKPVLLSVNGYAVYAGIPAGSQIFLVGPVSFSEPVEILRKESFPLRDDSAAERIPVCHFRDFLSDVLLAANLFRPQKLDSDAFLMENCVSPVIREDLEINYTEHTFENRERGKMHNPYDQEVREFTSIENGDIENLSNSLAEDYPGEIGTLARTPLRQMKNRGIVVVALASRAAIRGGILPETAYSLSDSYIQKIEDCSDLPSVMHLFHSAEYRYAQMVHDQKQSRKEETQPNIHTEKCKTYIFSHLHGKICVKDIAGMLNINANYLSEIFHAHEGMTITEYIHREKVELTKNLLVYSGYTYSEIAAYLGYSSQSHLGRQFKQYTGMTLRQYRQKYGAGTF